MTKALQAEADMSRFIGDIAHGQISAVEVDFQVIFEIYHDRQTCPHCGAMAASTRSSDAQQPNAATTFDGNGGSAVVLRDGCYSVLRFTRAQLRDRNAALDSYLGLIRAWHAASCGA